MSNNNTFSYQLGNKVYTTFEELGKDISVSWNLAKRHLQKNALSRAISVLDPVLANKVEVCRGIANSNRAVFVLQYLLNNSLNFSYKGLKFENLSLMGQAILDQAPFINEKIEEALRYGLITDYMKLKEIDINYPKHFIAVDKLEKEFKNDPLKTYFLLGYLFSEDKGFRFDGQSFTDQNALFNYLLEHDSVEEFVKIQWNVVYLRAWLEAQNLGAEVNKWEEQLEILEAWK